MWIEKIRRGVLQVSTDHGPRYVNPSLLERVQLVWMFRNFNILNPEVLNQHQRTLVKTLSAERRLLTPRKAGDPERLCIIGMVEPAQAVEHKRPTSATGAAPSFQRVHSA
jgi:hypothetical protein